MGTHHLQRFLSARVLCFCWALSWAGGIAACDRAPCAGLHAPSQRKNAPHIVSVRPLTQDVIDPWSIVIEVVFSAPTGDASDGSLDLYVGASAPVTVPLKPYFAPSGVALDATSGRLAVPIHLASSAVQDDSLFRLGLQLMDGSNRYSNCMTLELHMLVDVVGQRPRLGPRHYAVACHRAPTPAVRRARAWLAPRP